MTRWFAAFGHEIGDRRGDLAPLVARRLGAGHLWLWEHDGPAAFAAVSDPVEGVARIGPVYTRPDRRGRGYGSALVGAVSTAGARPGHALHPLHGPGQPHRELGLPEARLPRRRRSAALPLRPTGVTVRRRVLAGSPLAAGQPGDGSAATNPAMSRIVAAYTSGMATRKMASPAWQVPFTVRLTALTPASTSRR